MGQTRKPKTKFMKKIAACILVVVAICANSCQKELSAPIPTPPSIDSNYLLKTYTIGFTSSFTTPQPITFNVKYSANKQLTNLISTSNPGDKFVYTFPSATKYTMDIFGSNLLSIHEDIFTSSIGFTDSTYQYNNTKDTSAEKYFYNTNYQVITMNEYQFNNGKSELNNTINYSYNTDGDLITASGTDLNIESYTYYSNAVYVNPIVFGILNSASYKKMHLPKTYNLTSNGYVIATATYTYTFDAKGRVSTDTQTFTDGSVMNKSYTY